MSDETMRLILNEKPNVLVLGGPPTYLKGARVPETSIQRGIMNSAKLAMAVREVIFEHHVLRSETWRADAKPVFDAASKMENIIVTAAEYLNQPTRLLESRRQELYKKEEPSPEFLKWTKLPRHKRQLQSPPI
jgi:hypothetical protein